MKEACGCGTTVKAPSSLAPIVVMSIIVIMAYMSVATSVRLGVTSAKLSVVTSQLSIVTNQLAVVKFVADNALKQNEVLQLIYMNTLGQYIDALVQRRPSDLSREELALIQRYRPEAKFAKELAKRPVPAPAAPTTPGAK